MTNLEFVEDNSSYMSCHQCQREACICRFYPADYSLNDWLWLRRGWLDPKGDKEFWLRAQQSALGPNPHRKVLSIEIASIDFDPIIHL
jgi:hypothetical protein